MEKLDIVCCSKMLCILQSKNDSRFSRPCLSFKVVHRINTHEVLAMLGKKAVPPGKIPECFGISVRTADADSVMKYINP